LRPGAWMTQLRAARVEVRDVRTLVEGSDPGGSVAA
jgi:hypothetical protein